MNGTTSIAKRGRLPVSPILVGNPRQLHTLTSKRSLQSIEQPKCEAGPTANRERSGNGNWKLTVDYWVADQGVTDFSTAPSENDFHGSTVVSPF